jgi:hypothetical protein
MAAEEPTMTPTDARPNRLLNESSPYLRQHAYNPVDWYPWGPEALARARDENRPIFLSIGYSACHWCHVMEHESFADAETAQLMNEHFVCIKVDREERPDLDQIYMNAVTSLTGHGGWPMSVFLTPELEPFFAGTYFPPEDRHGLPSFRRLLANLAEVWRSRNADVLQSAEQIAQHLRAAADVRADGEPLDDSLIRNAVHHLERAFDPTHGGFGRAPKFPHALELRLLLRAWKRFGDDDALHMVRLTLDRMAMGGIYDHVGGGFHRYSTDARWLVPHFEKMLYDNAMLSVAYLEAFQATGESAYRQVVEEILDWVEREMTSLEGPFYSTLDADSDGVEGKFYVWSLAEVEHVLGKELAESLSYVYDVTTEGNWEGHTILNLSKTLAQNARLLRRSEEELQRRLAEGRKLLLAARDKRVRPGRDDKVLVAWNGLMVSAYALAAQVLDERYARPAIHAADYILKHMRTPVGTLLRTCLPGQPARLNAYLEDYSLFIDSLVTLYEATFDTRWIHHALELTEVMIQQFHDPDAGGFFFVGKDHEKLLVRGKDPHDGSTPSGNSVAGIALLRLAHLTGRAGLRDVAMRTLQLFRAQMAEAPLAFGQMLMACDVQLGPVDEIAVVGPASAEETREALRLIRRAFRPNAVIAFCDSDAMPDPLLALLAGKSAHQGRVTTYICRNFTCEAPIVGLEALQRVLDATRST